MWNTHIQKEIRIYSFNILKQVAKKQLFYLRDEENSFFFFFTLILFLLNFSNSIPRIVSFKRDKLVKTESNWTNK